MKIIAHIPNLLSFLRIVLSPVFAVLFVSPAYDDKLLGVIIFTIAALTDTCDGYLARRLHVVSIYGAFLDPLADKLLVVTGLLCLLWQGVIAWWLVAAIVGRDALVTWLRIDAKRRGVVFTTSWHAKIKTAAQFVALYLGFVSVLWPSVLLDHMIVIGMPLVALITMYTGIEYGLIYQRARK